VNAHNPDNNNISEKTLSSLLNKNLAKNEIPISEFKIDEKRNSNERKIIAIHELSKVGYSGPDKKKIKINQDSFFIYPNFSGISSSYYFGIWYVS